MHSIVIFMYFMIYIFAKLKFHSYDQVNKILERFAIALKGGFLLLLGWMWLPNDQLQDYYFLVYFTMFSQCNHEMLSSITLKQLFTKHTTKYHIKFNNLFILIMFNYILIVWCHATMAYESKFQTSHHLFRLKSLNIDLVIKFNVKHTFDYNYQTSKSHNCNVPTPLHT
jgi:fucose 4-O-acetylase-like acetyltransferase